MNLDFNAITATATVIALFVTLYAVWVENKRSRFSHGVDLLFRMSDLFFYNKDFIRIRKKAAEYLKKNLTLRKNSGNRRAKIKLDKSGEVELDAVLDFFEGLGILVHKKALDKELTYNYFSWWIECYYILAKDYITEWRTTDSNYWFDVEWLYQTFAAIKKNDGLSDKLSADELKIFIEHELSLK